MRNRFANRSDAGRQLATRLMGYAGRPDTLVLALPRGGVPVGLEIARALHVPLDVFIVRKIGVPYQPELAMGAIASGGVEVVNQETIDTLQIDEATFRTVVARERAELLRREQAYRGARPPLDVRRQSVIVVDDGLATGASMRSAVLALRQQNPAQIVVAVPVGAPSTCDMLRKITAELICLRMPEPFYAIGLWYEDFSQTSDAAVRVMLEQAWEFAAPSASSPAENPS